MVDSLPTPPTVQSLTFRIFGKNSLLGRISETAPEASTTDNGQEEDNLDDSYVDVDPVSPGPSSGQPSLLARLGDTPSSASFPVQPTFFRPDGTFTRTLTSGFVQLDTHAAGKDNAIEHSMASLSLRKSDVSRAQLPAEISNIVNGPTVQAGDTGVRDITNAEESSSVLQNRTMSSTEIESMASRVPITPPSSSSTALQTHEARPPITPSTGLSQEMDTPSLPRFVYMPLTELLQEEKAAWSEVLEKKQTQALTIPNLGLGCSSRVPSAESSVDSGQTLNTTRQSSLDKATQSSPVLTVANNSAVPSQPTASGPTLRLIPVLEMPAQSASAKGVNGGVIARSISARPFPSSFVDDVRDLRLSGPQPTGENVFAHVPGAYANPVAPCVRESSLSGSSLNTSETPCPLIPTTISQREDLQHLPTRASAVDSSEEDRRRSDTRVDTSRRAVSADIPSRSPVELPERPLSAVNASLQNSLSNQDGEAASPVGYRKEISSGKRKASTSLPSREDEEGASKRQRVEINTSSKGKRRVSAISTPQPDAVRHSLPPKATIVIHPLPPKRILNNNGTPSSTSAGVKRKTADSQPIKTEDNDEAPSDSVCHLHPSKQVKKEEDEDSKISVKVEKDYKLHVKVEEDLKCLAIGAGSSNKNVALKPPKDERGDVAPLKTEHQPFLLHNSVELSRDSANQERIEDVRHGCVADPSVASELFNQRDPPGDVQRQEHRKQDFRQCESKQRDYMQEDVGQEVLAQNEFGQEATEREHSKELQGSAPKNFGSLSLQNVPRYDAFQSILHQSEQSFGSTRHAQSREEAFNGTQSSGDRALDQQLQDASSEQLTASIPARLLSRSVSESTMSISPLETPRLTGNEIFSRQSSVSNSVRPVDTPIQVPVDDGVLPGGEAQMRRPSGERAFRLLDHWSPTPVPQRPLGPRPADTYRPRTPSPERFPPRRILDSYRPTYEREYTPPRYTWRDRNRMLPRRSRSRSPIRRRAMVDDTRNRPTSPPLIRERGHRGEQFAVSGSSGAIHAGVPYGRSDPSSNVGLRSGSSIEQGDSSAIQSQRVALDNASGNRRYDERVTLESGNAANTLRAGRQFIPNARYLRTYDIREEPSSLVNPRTLEHNEHRETVGASATAPLPTEREPASAQSRPIGNSEIQHSDVLRRVLSPQIVPSHEVTLPKEAQLARVEKCTDGSDVSNGRGVPPVTTASPSANCQNPSSPLQQSKTGPRATELPVNALENQALSTNTRRHQVESTAAERTSESNRNDIEHTVNTSTQAQHNRCESQNPAVSLRQSTAMPESAREVAQQTASVITHAGKSRDLPPSPASRKGQERPNPERIQGDSITTSKMPEYTGKPAGLETSPRSLRDRMSNEPGRPGPARQYPSPDVSSAANLASRIGDTLVIDESDRSASSTVSSIASSSFVIPLHLRLSKAPPQDPLRRHPLPSRPRPYYGSVDEEGGTRPSNARGQSSLVQAADEPSLLARMNESSKENGRRQNGLASRRVGQEQVRGHVPKSFATRKRPLGERLS